MRDSSGGAGRGAPGGLSAAAPAVATTIRTGGPAVQIAARVVPSYAADPTITWSTASALVSLSHTSGPDVLVTARNTTEDAQYVPIMAKAANGFFVTAYVLVEPKFIDPPAITSAPKISVPVDGKVTVAYGLDLGQREDQSLVTWFTCDDAAGANPRKVAVSRGNQPAKTYTLMPADVGKFLRVSIEPKHKISEAGQAVYVTATSPIAAADIPSSPVSADFRTFVESPTEPAGGRWTVLGDWSIVPEASLPHGYGIRAGAAGGAARGAAAASSSLFYFRDEPTGDMQLDLVVRPEKTEGTVFNVPGSPTEGPGRNSHGDIYIKYDPRTRSGYSLRYWRTTQTAGTCTYQFYKIDRGVGSPLDDKPVTSGVFKRNTTLTLKVSGSTISASAHNTTDGQTLAMEGTIVPNAASGAGVSATGAANIYGGMTISYP